MLQMSYHDQIRHILSRDLEERNSISESLQNCCADENLEIPRNVYLESNYSDQSYVTEDLRTKLFNHMTQFKTMFNVSELVIYHSFHILESVMTKLSISREDLEKFSLTSLFISLKFHEQFPGSVDNYCQLCSVDFSSTELLRLEREVLMATK